MNTYLPYAPGYAPDTVGTVALRTCSWCSGIHTGKCPLVKAIEYHPNGIVKRVEFYDPPKQS